MAGDKLSAREADLIAQARAQLTGSPAPRREAQSGAQPVRTDRPLPAAAIETPMPESADGAAPAQSAQIRDPAERIAALMAAARAESERERLRLRKLYVWVPLAFIAVLGLWALAWLWSKI